MHMRINQTGHERATTDIDDARVVDLNIAKEHIGNVIVLHHYGGMGAHDAGDAIE
jgi:hypothetical protein